MRSTDSSKDIQVWLTAIDDPVASFSQHELLGIIPCIGDCIKIPVSESDSEYFRVIERYICPNSHCSLTVEPMSGKGIEYRQSLMLSEEEQD